MKDLCLLGIDYGEKKLGLAVKERKLMRPAPIGCFKNQGDLLGKIVRLLNDADAGTVDAAIIEIVGVLDQIGGIDPRYSSEVKRIIENMRA